MVLCGGKKILATFDLQPRELKLMAACRICASLGHSFFLLNNNCYYHFVVVIVVTGVPHSQSASYHIATVQTRSCHLHQRH